MWALFCGMIWVAVTAAIIGWALSKSNIKLPNWAKWAGAVLLVWLCGNRK